MQRMAITKVEHTGPFRGILELSLYATNIQGIRGILYLSLYATCGYNKSEHTGHLGSTVFVSVDNEWK